MDNGVGKGKQVLEFEESTLLPVIEIPSLVSGKTAYALIDTGSTDTLVSSKCLNKFPYETLDSNVTMEVTGVVGEKFTRSQTVLVDIGLDDPIEAMEIGKLPGHQYVEYQINPEQLPSTVLNCSKEGRHFKGFDIILGQDSIPLLVNSIEFGKNFMRFNTKFGIVYSIKVTQPHGTAVKSTAPANYMLSVKKVRPSEIVTIKSAMIPNLRLQEQIIQRYTQDYNLDEIPEAEKVELLFGDKMRHKNLSSFHARVQLTPVQILNGYWAKFFAIEDMSSNDESLSYEEIESKRRIQSPGFLQYDKKAKKFTTELLLKENYSLDNNYNSAKFRLDKLVQTLKVSKAKTDTYRKEIAKFLELGVASASSGY